MKHETINIPLIDNSIVVNHFLFLYTTPNFLQDLTKRLLTLDRFVNDVHHLTSLWLKPLKHSNYYELLLPHAILLCTLKEDGFELNGMYEKSTRNHAQFLKEGIVLSLTKEVVVIDQQVICNKTIDKSCRSDISKMAGTVRDITNLVSFLHGVNQNVETELNHKIYEVEFEGWLSAYDQSASQHHESNIISQPQIKYRKISSDESFGSFTVLFYVDSSFSIPIKAGQVLYVKLVTNEWVCGAMQEQYFDEQLHVIVIQFEQLYTVSEFRQQGDLFIYLDKEIKDYKSLHIYYNQLQPNNVLKLLLNNQLDRMTDETTLSSQSIPMQLQSHLQLDDLQYDMMNQALAANQLFYIDGAVTTGKTRILNCIKTHYEFHNKRVLFISADNNQVNIDDENQQKDLSDKIVELRLLTLANMEQFESRILKDKNVISSYTNDALDLELAEEEHQKLTIYLKGFYEELEQNYVRHWKRLYALFNEYETTLDTLYTKLMQDEVKVSQQMSKTELGRWLTLPVLVKLQTRIKKNYEKFNTIKKKQLDIVEEYNEYAKKIKLFLADEQFMLKKDIWRAQRDHIDSLKEKLIRPITLTTIQTELYLDLGENQLPSTQSLQSIVNQLETMHLAYKAYRQKLLADDQSLFLTLFIKEKTSMKVSSGTLHKHLSLFMNEFDIVLIDDAHAFTILELFLAISLGKKVVITGDQNLLSININGKPYLQDVYNSRPLIYSKTAAHILTNLLPESIQGQLQFMYRVMPSLTTLFYTSLLQEDSTVRNKTLVKKIALGDTIRNPVLFLTTSQTKNRFENEIVGHGIYNHCEANAIIEQVVSLLSDENKSNQLKPEDILITSFFTMQVEYIRSHLRYALPNLSNRVINQMVKPILNCIGLERKIVFLSFCVSNKKNDSYRDLQDLRNQHLWTIALSRASHQLIMIGDVDYIKSAITNKNKHFPSEDMRYDWSSFEVAFLMKSLIKIASEGTIQFISLANFIKNKNSEERGFGYE